MSNGNSEWISIHCRCQVHFIVFVFHHQFVCNCKDIVRASMTSGSVLVAECSKECSQVLRVDRELSAVCSKAAGNERSLARLF